MDFVIAGFGVGAVLLLLGLAARDVGPRLSSNSSSTVLSSDTGKSSARFDLRLLVPLAGHSIMIGGAAVIIATFIGIFFQLSDQAAGRLVVVTAVGAVVFVGARLPFLIREKPVKAAEEPKPAKLPKAVKAGDERQVQPPRPRAQAKRKPILFASSPPGNSNGVVHSNGAGEKQLPTQEQPSQAPLVEEDYETPAIGSWGPNIFESDEPIQEGLLERLLAEDPNWQKQDAEPLAEDKVIDEAITIDRAPDPSAASESTAPGRPHA